MNRTRLDDYREAAEAALELFRDWAGDDAGIPELIAGLWAISQQKEDEKGAPYVWHELLNNSRDCYYEAQSELSKVGMRTVCLSADDSIPSQ